MTNITHGDVGDVWTPQASFTVGGTPTDPTNITVKIRDAAGTISTLGPVSGAAGGGGIVRVSAGVFNTVIPITAQGYWTCNFAGTGTAAASEDHEFIADPSAFTSNYGLNTRALVGVQETKDWLNQQNIDTSNDLDLVRVINDISDRIHEEAGREFKVYGTNPQTRLFDTDELAIRCGTVTVGDISTTPTTVQIQDKDAVVLATVAAGDIVTLPRNRAPWEPVRQLRFTSDVQSLKWGDVISVAGTWGFPSVPGNIRQACLDAVASVLDRDVEHYRTDLSPGAIDSGSVAIAMTMKPMFLSLPASVLGVVWSYRDLQVA